MTQPFDCFGFHTSQQFSKQSELYINKLSTKIFSKQKGNHCFHYRIGKYAGDKALVVIKGHITFDNDF